MKLTFKNKALYLMIPILVLMSSVYTYDAIKKEKGIMRADIIKRAEIITKLATKTGELPILSGNPELLKNAASFLKDTPGVIFVSFYDNKMNLLVHDGSPVPELPGNTAPGSAVTFSERDDFFDLTAPVFTLKPKEDVDMFQGTGKQASEVKDTIGLVRIGFSKAGMKKAEREIVIRGIILAVLFVTFSVVVVSILITIATRPLMLLFNAVKELERGEYPEVKITSHDEVGELAGAFDKMSTAIRDRELRLTISERRIRELFQRV